MKLIAVIYLRLWHNGPESTEDIQRLYRLREFARSRGYLVRSEYMVYDPEDALTVPQAYEDVRKALRENQIDVIILWHEDLNKPDTITRDDLHA